MGRIFEFLVLGGVVVLIGAVVVVAVVLLRRPSTLSSSRAGADRNAVVTGSGEADRTYSTVRGGQEADSTGALRAVSVPEPADADLQQRAEELMRTAEATKAEAEADAVSRRSELREQRNDLERREQRLADREERLDAEARGLDDRAHQLEDLKAELKRQRHELADAENQHRQALERVAGLTGEQAKIELISAVEHDAKRQAVLVAREIERQAVRDAETRAQAIVVDAIQRVASEQTSESVVSAVHLPGDEM